MKPLSLSVLVLILLAGCAKDEEIVYPAPVLKGKSLVKTSELLVYTGGRRLYDPEKIARFLSADPAWQEIDTYNDEGETLQFIRSDSAVLGGKVGLSASYRNGRIILKHAVPSDGTFIDFQFMDEIFKYPPETVMLPAWWGYGVGYYPVYVGYGSPKHFRFFVTIYKTSRNRGFSVSQQSAVAFNEFNKNATGMLTSTDTLAVQTFELAFSR